VSTRMIGSIEVQVDARTSVDSMFGECDSDPYSVLIYCDDESALSISGSLADLRRVLSGLLDEIRVLALCHKDGTPANVEAVES
jgi:hypothetical protein